MGLETAQAFAEAGAAVVLADVREELVKAEAISRRTFLLSALESPRRSPPQCCGFAVLAQAMWSAMP
jgi:NAD(P)-dependent dehydrogenase (short-subunit alcohol dehydrogenase family)